MHISGAGTCTITASQAGDGNYNPAPNVVRSFSISASNQTITFAALPDKTFGDADFTVSATASSGLAVTFTAAGSCTVTGSTVHITGAGSCTITASQAGNANFNPAPDVSRTFAIAKEKTTTTYTGATGSVLYGSTITLSGVLKTIGGVSDLRQDADADARLGCRGADVHGHDERLGIRELHRHGPPGGRHAAGVRELRG